MKLADLLKKLKYTCVKGTADVDITTVAYDSRRVERGSLFICIKGAVADGHRFAEAAVNKGASALVVEDDVTVPENVTVIRVIVVEKLTFHVFILLHPPNKLVWGLQFVQQNLCGLLKREIMLRLTVHL